MILNEIMYDFMLMGIGKIDYLRIVVVFKWVFCIEKNLKSVF